MNTAFFNSYCLDQLVVDCFTDQTLLVFYFPTEISGKI